MKWLMLALLRLYKLTLSPVLRGFGVRCRYHPDCADYSRIAVTEYGAWAGGWMTLARLQRCHPVRWLGGSSGVDNVPELKDKPPVWTPWKYGVWKHDAEGASHADTDLP